MKSYVAKPCDVNRKWYVVDAKDVVLGRLATEAVSYTHLKIIILLMKELD